MEEGQRTRRRDVLRGGKRTTRVKFSAAGTYELELSATDGEKRSALKVTVQVS